MRTGTGSDAVLSLYLTFFNSEILKVPDRPYTGLEPVTKVSINHDKMYCFLELSAQSDAEIAMCMDGIRYGTIQLRVRRPKTQNADPPAIPVTFK